MGKNIKFKEVDKEVSSMRKKRGQSVLEYAIVLTVIVAAIAYAATQYIKPAVDRTINSASKSITDAAGRLPGN